MFMTCLAANSTCVRLTLPEATSVRSVVASLASFAAQHQEVAMRLVGLDEGERAVTVRFSASRSHPVLVKFPLCARLFAPRVVVAPRTEEWSAAMAFLSGLAHGDALMVLRDEHDLAFWRLEQESVVLERRVS